MGTVYEASHVQLERPAAIKTLHPRLMQSPAVLGRFLREARAAARINHPHVVDVCDGGVDGEIPYLVMEYLEGESLGTLFKREGPLGVTRAVDILLPVVRGLALAHESGIVHRDIKPDTIFVCPRRSGTVCPKVLDFGISKILNDGQGADTTTSAAMLGTPYYM